MGTQARVLGGRAAQCTTDWPTVPASRVACVRLAASLAHIELRLDESRYDARRFGATVVGGNAVELLLRGKWRER